MLSTCISFRLTIMHNVDSMMIHKSTPLVPFLFSPKIIPCHQDKSSKQVAEAAETLLILMPLSHDEIMPFEIVPGPGPVVHPGHHLFLGLDHLVHQLRHRVHPSDPSFHLVHLLVLGSGSGFGSGLVQKPDPE